MKKPIVTTGLIHGTGELLYDIYAAPCPKSAGTAETCPSADSTAKATYQRFLQHHVEKHSKTATGSDLPGVSLRLCLPLPAPAHAAAQVRDALEPMMPPDRSVARCAKHAKRCL